VTQSARQNELIGPLLREVSRSFYLTLRVLPSEIRPQISLAYLLARASDTIADTKTVSRARRLDCLRQLQSLANVPALGELAEHQSLASEKLLLEQLRACFGMLATLDEQDQRLIRDLLRTIIGGQIFDLEKFPGESAAELVALADDDELDRYTYMVAGCVGEFWTKMCQAHLPAMEGLRVEEGIRFGKGLQLVNVLRDIPKDLRIGRCYLPVKEPHVLLDPLNFDAIGSLYGAWLDRAVEHLRAGWQYTLRIPPSELRLRLACIWPIWIGLRTIALLRMSNPLDPSRRIKVSRAEVYKLMALSLAVARYDCDADEYTQRLFARAS
jgi:farnesyl-diphosphate farnesyltransferase